MSKNIAVITALLTTGGGDRLLESIYPRFIKRGYSVTVYSLYPCKGNDVLKRAGVIVKTPPFFLYPLFRVLRLRRLFDPLFHSILECRIRADHNRAPFAWVSMYHFGTYPLVGMLKNVMGCPLYYTEISSPKGRNISSTINEFDEVFVPSVTIGEELVKYEGLKNGYIPIPFFVDLKENPPLPPHLHTPAPAFGAIARLSPEKDLGFLIDTLACINSVNPNIKLVLIGSGPELKKLKARASNNVKFIPRFNSLNQVMKEFDVLVLSSDIEGMPLTIIEAMAYGKPIVSTPAGSVPEMITHGENGFICSKNNPDCFANALRAILENEERFKYMSACSRKRFEKCYNPEEWFRMLLEVFENE